MRNYFITKIEVECLRCGTEFEQTKGDVLIKKPAICKGCLETIKKKFYRRTNRKRLGRLHLT